MFKILKTSILLFLAIEIGYIYRVPLGQFVQRLEARALPCEKPITYSIGTFDPRFGINEEDFKKSIAQAVKIWEDPVHKPLFAYAANGALKINLIYDFRQEDTQQLQKLGIVINDDRATYNILQKKYNSLQYAYNQQKAVLDARIASYQANKKAYEEEVNYWNRRGGAPEYEYNKLEQEKIALNAEVSAINQLQDALNAQVPNINAAASVLNKLAYQLNLTATKYNGIGADQGSEFEEGLYQSDINGQKIDIYQFDSKDKLVRVLAHELGHALGLEHIDNPDAIMYRLNQGKNQKLTVDDIAALKTRCGIR